MGTSSVYSAIINIEGTIIGGHESVNINQAIHHHHSFTVVFDHTLLTQFSSAQLGPGKGLIGKSILINIARQPGEGPPMPSLDFKGMITDIKLTHPNGYYGQYEVSGHGSSIMTDATPSHASWQAIGLAPIVKMAMNGIPGNDCQLALQPAFSGIVPWYVSYRGNHLAVSASAGLRLW